MSSATSSNLVGTYSYTHNSAIHYGPGILNTSLPKLLSLISPNPKVLILTGQSLAKKTDVIQKVEAVLGDAHIATFTNIGEHAPEQGIRDALRLFNEKGGNAIVAVGGGSPIDSAKAMSWWNKNELGNDWIRSIFIPTTLSAAEFTSGAGFTKDGKKTGVGDDELAATGILLDAELTLATPERLWLSTAIRALDHAIETLYRPYAPPPIKSLAYAAIQELFGLLPACKTDPKDVAIRQKLQLAAWKSLFPYRQESDKKSAIGPSHQLGYALGAPYHIPHGITSCITLGSVVKWQGRYGKEEDKEYLQKVLWYIGEESTGDISKDVEKVGDAINGLVERLGLTTKMSESGVPEADIEQIASGFKNAEGESKEYILALLRSRY